MEGKACSTFAAFRYGSIGIGDRFPRPGSNSRQKYCPLCPIAVLNTPYHVAFQCSQLEQFRKTETCLSSFRNVCMAGVVTEQEIMKLFLNGLDWKGKKISKKLLIQRGNDLGSILEFFLSKWQRVSAKFCGKV